MGEGPLVTGLFSPAARQSYCSNTLAAFCAGDRIDAEADSGLHETQAGTLGLQHVRARIPDLVPRPPPGLGRGHCLVGGGQEINTGEAGISEWLAALDRSVPAWRI